MSTNEAFTYRIETAAEMLAGHLDQIITRATQAREALAKGQPLVGGVTGPDPLGHQTVADVLRSATELQAWVDAAVLAGVDRDTIVAAYAEGGK